jgi:hypothetical protein
MNLQPQANFTVVRQLANHLDTDTNYVRAVIRNAYTDAIIDTLNLTDKGSQRFKKDWQVPADPSGQGFYISIVTSVYTDSGYTTKNSNYGDEENTYLVQERVMPLMRGGGGIDAAELRYIVKDELSKLPKPEPVKIPKQQMPVDRTNEILSAIDRAKPTIEKPNFSPVLTAVERAMRAIEEKEVTPATDLSPVLEKIQRDTETNGADFQEVKDMLAKLESSIIQKVESTVKQAMDQAEFTSTFAIRQQPEQPKEQQPSPIDISKIAV